ncbi:MAG: hypothetical protein CMM67_05480 [Rhodospirillaceae bacterium]|nr:hypothetical protein [Rhodospirillaceae bacterium]OUT79134.1 MAG: hypothetical protein CBB83_05665 [Rhodospirillaceae bacterium TMED23]|tara:strand:- start:12507 stop:13370 length:864 start_codon:yes stop_codon:yes gene_type:complete
MQSFNPRVGIIFMVLAMLVNSSKDGIAKLLAEDYTPLSILLIQFIATSIILGPLVIKKYGLIAIIPRNPLAQLIRASFVTSGVGLYYWAINYINIADATAMIFIAPIIVTALSPWILDEPLGIRRTTAVIIGFIGVLIILRPTMEGDRIGYFIALASGIFLGAFYIANRKLSGSTPVLSSAFYTSFFGLIFLIPFLSLYWVKPDLSDTAIFLGFTSLATLGQVLMVAAFSFAPANIIAPFQYSQMIGATLISYFLFGALPDQWGWVGISVVIGAGLYIAIREAKINN